MFRIKFCLLHQLLRIVCFKRDAFPADTFGNKIYAQHHFVCVLSGDALTHMRKTVSYTSKNRPMTQCTKPRLPLILINMSMCSDEPSSPVTLHYAHITSHFSHSLK